MAERKVERGVHQRSKISSTKRKDDGKEPKYKNWFADLSDLNPYDKGSSSTKRRVDSSSKRRDDSYTKRRDDSSTKRRDDSYTKRTDDSSAKRRDDSSTKRTDDSSTKRRDDSSTKRRDDSSTKRRDDSSTKRRDDDKEQPKYRSRHADNSDHKSHAGRGSSSKKTDENDKDPYFGNRSADLSRQKVLYDRRASTAEREYGNNEKTTYCSNRYSHYRKETTMNKPRAPDTRVDTLSDVKLLQSSNRKPSYSHRRRESGYSSSFPSSISSLQGTGDESLVYDTSVDNRSDAKLHRFSAGGSSRKPNYSLSRESCSSRREFLQSFEGNSRSIFSHSERESYPSRTESSYTSDQSSQQDTTRGKSRVSDIKTDEISEVKLLQSIASSSKREEDSRESSLASQKSSKQSSGSSHSPSGKSIDKKTIANMDDHVKEMIAKGVIHYSRNTRFDIQRFFSDEVQLRQAEIETAAKHFQMLQKEVEVYLESNTPWKWKAFRAGSHYDGTKVSRPNEMDCVLIPDLLFDVEPVYDGCVPGYCQLRVTSPQQDIAQLCDDGFINKKKYRDFIFGIMDNFVKDHSAGQTKCTKNLTHPASPSYGVVYDGVSTAHGSLLIDIDFVPVIQIQKWPPKETARDLRKLPKDISASIKGECIMDQGVNLVTTPCPGSDKELQWKVSCSYAEKTFTKYGENKCWKPVLRTMKRMVEITKGIEGLTITGKSLELQKAAEYTRTKYLKCKNFQLSFSTYYIRSLMWSLLYDLSAGNHLWRDETQEARLHFSLTKLRHMVTGEITVPNFFIPTIKDIMAGTRQRDREFMYIMIRATETVFSKSP